jgi:polyisoprenoid-binding protein YceI
VGELTVKGKSTEVTLNVDAVDRSCSPQGEEVIYYTAMTELDRSDFGIMYGRGAIGRKLKVVINVQALKQA